MSRRKKQKLSLIQVIIGFIMICLLSYVSYHYEEIGAKIEDITAHQYNQSAIKTEAAIIVEGELQMHTIDVGQGDSILICEGENTILVDSGTKANGETVVYYLKKLGISQIDALVATHPHDDHMGGMAEVIKNFEIGTLYALNHSEDNITTIWYQEFLDAVIEKNVNWVFPKVEDEIRLGQITTRVIAPIKRDETNLNNNSIILRVSFGDTDILLTGDTEKEVEQELVKQNIELESEVLKVAHHGSDSSSTKSFLEKVKPQYAIISAKKENTYGHPKQKVMDLLKSLNTKVYRTDEQGTIIMKTDGTNIEFNIEPGTYQPGV